MTGGESAELALALWALGESDRALEILQSIQHLRDPESGLYWTGYVFEDKAVWPKELTTWTARLPPLLAVAALGGDEATCTVFSGNQLPRGLDPDCCA
ncbi:Prenyltransferase OS=Streptomyces alboniger OX=132473 GN=CP975_10385 PE=4 SV=1 [Streptomyces alboniger]